MVRDPNSGELLKLPRDGWLPLGTFETGVSEDFFGPDDIFQLGPNTVVRGARRRVFFLRSNFAEVINNHLRHSEELGAKASPGQKTEGHNATSVAAPLRSEDQANPRGRKPGQGSYKALDAPLLVEMGQLLSEGKAASAEEAARQVASRAHGGGTVESKAERLARRFRKHQTGQAPIE
jgi:hypothetical protein